MLSVFDVPIEKHLYNYANPAGEAVYNNEIKQLLAFNLPAVGQLHYNVAPVEDAKDIYEFLVLLAFIVLAKKQ